MKSKPDTYATEYYFDIKVEYHYYPPVFGKPEPESGGLYLEPLAKGEIKIVRILSSNGTDITKAFDSKQLRELEDEIGGEIDAD